MEVSKEQQLFIADKLRFLIENGRAKFADCEVCSRTLRPTLGIYIAVEDLQDLSHLTEAQMLECWEKDKKK